MDQAADPTLAADEAHIDGLARQLALGNPAHERLRAERERQRQLAAHYEAAGRSELAASHARLAEHADALLRPQLSTHDEGPRGPDLDEAGGGLSLS